LPTVPAFGGVDRLDDLDAVVKRVVIVDVGRVPGVRPVGEAAEVGGARRDRLVVVLERAQRHGERRVEAADHRLFVVEVDDGQHDELVDDGRRLVVGRKLAGAEQQGRDDRAGREEIRA
jgi:hypothetical protein